jgi:hypothetical protein
MKSKLLTEKISVIEELPLSDSDLKFLKNEIFRQLKIFLPAYLVFIGICIYFIFRGPEVSTWYWTRLRKKIDIIFG